MKYIKRLFFQLVLFNCFLCTCFIQAQTHLWSGILNPLNPTDKGLKQSAIDWNFAGIPGGVPSLTWTQCGSTIKASDFGNGTLDATAAINSALAACAANHYVLLSQGTFLVNSAAAGSPYLKIAKDRTLLRGSGASSTVLVSNGTNYGGIIRLGSGVDPGGLYGANNSVLNAVNITSGATAGSNQITVASATYFATGKNMVILELNDPSYVTKVGGSGSCTYCDGFWSGDRSRGQIVEITAVSGSTITFTPALYTAYTLTPQALPFTPVRYAGLENLQIYSTNTHTTQTNAPILIYTCAYCWVKGVEENYADGDFIKMTWSYRAEVRDSYFSNTFDHGPGSNNGSVLISSKTSASKVENNIMERSENPVMFQFGAAGNVIAYNFATGAFALPSSTSISAESHSVHSQFNLLEGNIFPGLWLDSGHGSSSQTTSFRNWYKGSSFVCYPQDGSRGTVDCSGSRGVWTYEAARAITIDSLDSYDNLIGDIAGSSMHSNLSGSKLAAIRWPTTRSYTGVYGLSFGYTLKSDSGTDSLDSTKPSDTTFVHGLYNHIDGSITWADSVGHTLPPSFYLSAKPTWWRATLPFPAIGPDVSTMTGPGGHAGIIPAQWCYFTVMGGVEGGGGGPRTFNANACYGPPAPLGITGIVR